MTHWSLEFLADITKRTVTKPPSDPVTATLELRRSQAGEASMICWKRSRTASIGTRQSRSMSTIDRKSTRLNSSYVKISYAVFCLNKEKTFALGMHVNINPAHKL